MGKPMDAATSAMKNIRHINIDYHFLIEEYGFELVEVLSSPSFGGEERAIFKAEHVYVKIVLEREQYAFYFSNTMALQRGEWYDWDIVKQYIDGNKSYTMMSIEESLGELYDRDKQLEKARVTIHEIKSYFPEVLKCFSMSDWRDVEKFFRKLENQRAKSRYG